jgi:RHS repeat-associated protein
MDGLRLDQTVRLLGAAMRKRGETPLYDANTRQIRATNVLGHTWLYQLTSAGRVEAIQTPMGRLSRVRFDDRGRIEELVEPNGRHTMVPSDEQGAPTRFVRNGADLVRFTWNPSRTDAAVEFWDGSRAQMTYSAAGKPLLRVDRLGRRTTFTYDGDDRIVELRDGRDGVTRFEYDDLGRPSRTHHADGRVESLTYLAPGTVGLAQGSERVLDLTLDARQQPTFATYADGKTYAFSYDDAGRLTSAESAEAVCSYEYRQDGKLVGELAGDQSFRFEYDALGRLSAQQYPDGTHADLAYDPDGRPSHITWGSASFAFSYDGSDRKRIVSTPRLQTQYELDLCGKPSHVRVVDSAKGKPVFETSYRYDHQARLVWKRDSAFGGRLFAYDTESQVLRVSDESGRSKESFAYDAAGNPTLMSDLGVVVAPGNRVTSRGDVQCKYDARGNIVVLTAGGQTWRFVYDLRNQLIESIGPSGSVVFKYDAFGRRIEKRSADRTIRYVWCGELLTREIVKTSEGESVRDYLYFPGSCEPIVLRVDGRFYYYHNDHAGTPQRLTDEQGEVVWAADYSAFGDASVVVSGVENPLRFPGQYFDAETGLHYNRFRYYSPRLGRYLSVDPASLLGGHNLYAYANNDPINASDPLGLFSWGAALAAVGAGIATAALVVCAPAVAAVAVVAVGAFALGFAIGMGVGEYMQIGNFCAPCFWKGVKDAAPAAFGIGLGIGVLSVLCPPLGLGLGVAAAVYGVYSMLDAHFGWSSGKPYDQMTDEEKSEHLGGLVGGTVAGILGGLVGGLGARGVMRAVKGTRAGPTEGGAAGEETSGGKTGRPEKITSPNGKEIDATANDDSMVPNDKVDKYMRGKAKGTDEDVNDQIRELNRQKQADRKAFDADPENQAKLDQLKQLKHNADRSTDMAETLKEAGIEDTPEENARIKEHLLEQGAKATPENPEVESVLHGKNGDVKVISTWKTLPDGRSYLSTVKAIPMSSSGNGSGVPAIGAGQPPASEQPPAVTPIVPVPGEDDEDDAN